MNKVTAAVPTQALALSAEQWQGLARLADLVNALSGPLAGPVTGTLDHLLGLANRHDLGALSTEVVATIEALHKSGLLRLLRENAELLAGSMALLVPLLGSLPEKLNAMPFAGIRNDLDRLHGLLDKAELLGAYATEHLAGPTVRWSVDAANFAQREALGDSLKDLLQTLSHLHRNGSLAWLRDISDYLDEREQQRLLDSLAEQGIGDAAALPGRARTVLHGVQAALDDAAQDAGHLGGVKGLLHLLRDAEVQRGLRALAVLPTYLQKQDK